MNTVQADAAIFFFLNGGLTKQRSLRPKYSLSRTGRLRASNDKVLLRDLLYFSWGKIRIVLPHDAFAMTCNIAEISESIP